MQNKEATISAFCSITNLPSRLDTSHEAGFFTLSFTRTDWNSKIFQTEPHDIPESIEDDIFIEDSIKLPFKFQSSIHIKISLNYHTTTIETFDLAVEELVGSDTNSIILFSEKNKKEKKGVKISMFFETLEDNSFNPFQNKFLEYLYDGLKISLITCIDFTQSNGSVNNPMSLHFRSPQKLNDYQQVVFQIGNILLNYDSDHIVPCYGFGGIPQFTDKNSKIVSHFFPLSGDQSKPGGYKIEGCFQLYQHALDNCKLGGPTFFQPMLTEVIDFSRKQTQIDPYNYTILLIITDGMMHDSQNTIKEIIKGCDTSLSIIIVGVGDADFSRMEMLDSDHQPLSDNEANQSKRDIVQFVSFNEIKQTGFGNIAEKVLEEVPKQVVEAMELQGLKPRIVPNDKNEVHNGVRATKYRDNFKRMEDVHDDNEVKGITKRTITPSISFHPVQIQEKNVNGQNMNKEEGDENCKII